MADGIRWQKDDKDPYNAEERLKTRRELQEKSNDITFTFRAFGTLFYPKRPTKSTFIEGDSSCNMT